MQVTKEIKRDYAIDLWRLILSILVVIGHATYYSISTKYGGMYINDEMTAAGIQLTMVRKITNAVTSLIYGFHMPAFFVISGIIFARQLEKGKFQNGKELIKNKAERLLIPYIFVWLVWNMPIKIISGYYENLKKPLVSVMCQILDPYCVYLWFLPALFFDFLLVYYLRKYIKSETVQFCLLCLLFAIGILIGRCNMQPLGNPFKYAIWLWLGTKMDVFCKRYLRNINSAVYGIMYLVLWGICYMRDVLWEGILYQTIIPLIGTLFLYGISKDLILWNSEQIIKMVGRCNKYTLGLYLWAEPLNYLIMEKCADIWGIQIFASEIITAIIYIIRILGTSAIAVFIVHLLKKVKFGIKVY